MSIKVQVSSIAVHAAVRYATAVGAITLTEGGESIHVVRTMHVNLTARHVSMDDIAKTIAKFALAVHQDTRAGRVAAAHWKYSKLAEIELAVLDAIDEHRTEATHA